MTFSYRVLILTLAAVSVVGAAQNYSVQNIPLPSGLSNPTGPFLHNDGSFLIYTYLPDSPIRDVLLWNGRSFENVNTYSDALRNKFDVTSMNESGQIAGVAYKATTISEGRWSLENPLPLVRQRDGTYRQLRMLNSMLPSIAGISDSGSVIGLIGNQPFIWPSVDTDPVPLAPDGSSRPMIRGLNTQGTYAIQMEGGTLNIVQSGVAHDTGIHAFDSYRITNQNRLLFSGYAFDYYFWNGESVVPMAPELLALSLNSRGTVLVHDTAGLSLWNNGIVDPLTDINNYLRANGVDPFYLPGGAALNGKGQILLSYGSIGSGSVYLFSPVPPQPLCTQRSSACSAPDFDGNGRPDLIWQNAATRQVTTHYYGGSYGITDLAWNWLYPSLGAAGWHVAAIADFNGDGKPDLAWQNDATGQVTVHYYGGALGSGGAVDIGWNWLYSSQIAGWRVVAASDFNGDGVPDLVWQNDSGQVVVHYYGGTGGATDIGWNWLYASPIAGWRVAAAADFNGDTIPDLVWQSDTGQVVVHYYGGAAGATDLGWNWLYANPIAGWRVATTADFNQDGVPDLVWQNTTSSQVVVHYYGGPGGATDIGWNWLYSGNAVGWSVK